MSQNQNNNQNQNQAGNNFANQLRILGEQMKLQLQIIELQHEIVDLQRLNDSKRISCNNMKSQNRYYVEHLEKAQYRKEVEKQLLELDKKDLEELENEYAIELGRKRERDWKEEEEEEDEDDDADDEEENEDEDN